MILFNVATADLPRRGSMPRSLKVRLANPSSRWIRYWPSSYLRELASLECAMKDSIMHSAHFDVTMRWQPSSLTLNF